MTLGAYMDAHSQTRSRVNGRAVRYDLSAPRRKRLIDQAGDAACADHAARRAIYRPDTAETDSLIEHLRAALELAKKAHSHVLTSERGDFAIAQDLAGLEAVSS